MLMVRGAAGAGGFLVRSLVPGGVAVDGVGGARSFRAEERLAFRPREAKNPPVLVDGVEGANERMEEGGVPLAMLDVDRGGYIRCPTRDG